MPQPRPLPPRPVVALAVAALAAGLGIGYVDSRPSWDDTGVTVVLLVAAAAVAAVIAGDRPWVWALLVGAPVPIIEVPASGSLAPLAALACAAIGAGLGFVARRAVGGVEPTT
jgi:hypothetical protein